MKAGYGNRKIFGSIKNLYVYHPEEPNIEDIGHANSHLKEGYHEIWELKNKLFVDYEKLAQRIEKIIQSFEARGKTILENNGFKPFSEDYDKCSDDGYYLSGFFKMVFNMIKDKDDDVEFKMYISGDYNNQRLDVKSDSAGYLFDVKYVYDNSRDTETKIKHIIQILKNYNNLKDIVEEYEQEEDSFYLNEDKKNLFKLIDELYIHVVNKNEDLNGNCKLCQPRRWIDRF